MIEAIHPKKTYLTRAIYAALLIAGIYGGIIIHGNGEGGPPLLSIICMVLLSFLSMKVLSEVFSRLTNMSFFLSFGGMFVLFMVSMLLSIIIGPLYLVFNVIQYLRAPS